MTLIAFDWVESHIISIASPSSVPWTHTSDALWTPIPGATTGSLTLQAGTDYRLTLMAELKTTNALQEARIRIYDVTGAAAVIAAHTNQTIDGEWRTVMDVVTPGAGAREYRLEGKIDNGAQTITVNHAHLVVEHL